MTLWPDEYEPLRAEARATGTAAANAFRASMERLSAEERLVKGRLGLEAMAQDAPGGRDEVLAGVDCRVFDPAGDERAGTYLNIHGGAMMWGSPRMNDTANGEIAKRLGVRVVSPDYRLAPEHPHPAGSDDCLAAAKWVLDHEPGPIAIGGESAGGYFSALTLLRIRDELDAIDRITGANLVFGVFDLGGTPSNRGARPTDLPEMLEGNTDYVLEGFLPGRTREDARDPSISPLYAELWNMPPALFTIGLADRLLDDSLFMAARWQAYGCAAELAVYPDCVHGFTFFPIELARRANERIDQFLAAAFRVA
jgi:acetyl esterase/lipase